MPQLELADQPTAGLDDAAWTEIFRLLTEAYPCEGTLEKRRDTRYPFPFAIYVTPVADDGTALVDESIAAAGKDLSEGGMGFYHSEPLPSQRLIVSMERGDGHWLGLLLDLTRSRAILQNWHESSGRFVETVPSPLESV